MILTTAELAAEEHGDARRAVRLFRNAGEIADEEGDEIVTANHVFEADELVEVELFIEMVKGTPLSGNHSCLLSRVLTGITRRKNGSGRQRFTRFTKQ